MAQREEVLNLENLADGGASELFEAAVEQVSENILDPNTEAEAVRKIVLEITVRPLKTRDQAVTSIKCSTKLAPAKNLSTMLFFGRQGGKAVAVGADPRQGKLFDDEREATVAGRIKATGE